MAVSGPGTYRRAQSELNIAVIVLVITIVIGMISAVSSYFRMLDRLAKLEAQAASKVIRGESVVLCKGLGTKRQCVDIDAVGIVRSGGTLVPCSDDPKRQWWPCAR